MPQIGGQGGRLKIGARFGRAWGPVLLIGVAVVLGLLGGGWMVRSRIAAAPPTLTLSPEVIDRTGRRMTDRDPLRVEFTLRNDSALPIIVTRIIPTCTCTTIMPEGQIEPPFTLSPGVSTTFSLTTNLASRFGPQSYVVTIASSADGRELPPLMGRVDVVVDSPLAAFPPALDAERLAPGQEIRRRIVLGDTLDANTVRIDAITSSDPSVIAVAERRTSEVVERGKGYLVRGRYALDVTIMADDRAPARHELITIRLSDGRELNVPVTWSVSLPFEIAPRTLIVAGVRPGRRVERSIFVRLDADQGDALHVVEKPEGFDVRIVPFGTDQKRLWVAFTVPEPGRSIGSPIVLAAGREGRRITIPVDVRYD